MVFILVTSFSYIYISELLRQRVTSAHETASLLAQQLAYAAYNAQPDLTSTRVDTDDPKAVRAAIADSLAEDVNLNNMMESVVGSWLIIYDVAIVDNDNKALLHTNPDLVGKVIPPRPDFSFVRDAHFRRQLKIVYSPAAVYEVHTPLQLNGAPFGTVRIGVATVFLKNEVTPKLRHAIILSSLALLASLILAAGLSNLALGPLERISRSLDTVTAGDGRFVPTADDTVHDEYGLVTLKIAHLGRQMRDTKEIFSALKDNVDQIMANLQDGLMLFTRDSRVVLVSASVEQFLGRPRGELLGRTASEIFSNATPLGSILLTAFDRKWPITQREVGANGKRIQVSLDFIHERGAQIGALLTMRDAESVRRIEDEIETSRRLSASSRITRGVAHEVKNPINAIVLHLQLLQHKLDQVDPDAKRHMDIIGSEIHRLDRVVQILVDFTRQRELHMEEIDLRRLIDEVVLLALPDAEVHRVRIVRDLPEEPLTVKVDEDFMKQALLNVVINGEQAMGQGGTLTIAARRDEGNALVEVRDQGSGIPKEIQDKIFELYFTTKQGGSGIGLAQTYQILQWHYGSVDFESIEGQGTTFRLRVPMAQPAAEIAPSEKEVTAEP